MYSQYGKRLIPAGSPSYIEFFATRSLSTVSRLFICSSNGTGFGWIFAFQMGWKEIKRRWVTFHVHICFDEYCIPPSPPSPPPPLTRPLARSLLTVYCYCDSAPDEMWAKNMSLLNTGLSEVVCISLLTRLSIYDSHPNLLHFIYWSFCTFNGKWILNWFWLVSLPCRISI